MTRPIKAQIDLAALKSNYQLAKTLSAGPALAVIKANAYGHGAVRCAQALSDTADGFAVASLEEARELRQAGIQSPILLLEGFFEATELSEIAALDCWLVIHASWQVTALLQYLASNDDGAKTWHVWLKVDTGMHRLGLTAEDAVHAYAQLKTSLHIQDIKLMTHFANADDVSDAKTLTQMQVLQQLVDQVGFSGEISVANSAAILGWQDLKITPVMPRWARPGLMLYGANPFYGTTAQTAGEALQAVMTLSSQVISVQTIQAGEAIGYGGLFQAQETMRIGVVACGYADGYPRTVVHAPAMVAGQMTRVIGRVSMDMLFINLENLPDVTVGADVELWGKHVSVDAVAVSANTLAYELLCNVKRTPFIYR